MKKTLFFYVTIIYLALSFLILSCKSNTKEDINVLDNVDHRNEMRLFVQNISAYAKKINPSFIIIPQNGHELLTQNGEPNGIVASDYTNAIDAIGREDLFYGYTGDNLATPTVDKNEMVPFLDVAVNNGLKVMTIDYCSDHSKMDDSYAQNAAKGYISFAADHRELDNIPLYPGTPYNVNSNNVLKIADAKNFLYIINPSAYISATSFFSALSATNYDVILIDLFFNDSILKIDSSLKKKQNGGSRLVIAYMSIGEAEDYRYYWDSNWKKNPPTWLSKENPDWPGNYKVKYWYQDWQSIIFGNDSSYLKKIIDAGFDGVYLDLIDAYEYFEKKK